MPGNPSIFHCRCASRITQIIIALRTL